MSSGVKLTELVISLAVGLVAALAIDFFPVLALIVLTAVLLVGVARRVVVAVLAPAIACLVFLVLLGLALMRCDPALQDCTVEGPTLVLSVWLASVVVVGAAATVLFVARSRPL
jgi:hypothetical protein